MPHAHHLARVLAPALLLVVSLAAQLAGAGAAMQSGGVKTAGSRIGFSNGYETLWLSDADLAADLDGMAATGARWLRVDFDWPSVQAGGRNHWNWSHIDRVVLSARARGISILAMPAYTPTWARPAGTTDKTPPKDPADYARFVRAAVLRYHPLGVRSWEIWNEPNTADFWQPRPNVTAYARLFESASRAIHDVDPGATVITGGLAPAANVEGSTVAPFTFVVKMYHRGLGRYLDAVGMHPYTFPYAPRYAADWNPFYKLPTIYRIMRNHRDSEKKIWATEVGWGTGSSSRAVSDETQADYSRRLVDAWLTYPFAANLFWYSFRDHGSDRGDVWQNMGLVRRDWSGKLARDALASKLVRPIA